MTKDIIETKYPCEQQQFRTDIKNLGYEVGEYCGCRNCEVRKDIASTQEERDRDTKEALYALGLMWNQYCGKEGHLFMTAGEQAEIVLQKYGLLDTDAAGCGVIDYDRLDDLLSDTKTNEK